MQKRHVKLSKFLSYVLRHDPAAIGLQLDAHGWASVSELIEAAARKGYRLTPDVVAEVVAQNDKRRFSLSPDGQRIRANYGHSLPVDLGLEPTVPPERLYHGTARRTLGSIMRKGLQPGRRQFVHLSSDIDTAREVGRRHGRPVVLVVEAGRMHDAGFLFYLSESGIWLTRAVPPEYLKAWQPDLC